MALVSFCLGFGCDHDARHFVVGSYVLSVAVGGRLSGFWDVSRRYRTSFCWATSTALLMRHLIIRKVDN